MTNKTQRLYFKSYLQFIKNSVGSSSFKNFYVKTQDGVEIDALSDGSNSCAFFVSSVLIIFNRLSGVHGTIISTLADLQESGWTEVEVDDIKSGDVLLWEEIEFDGNNQGHIGFYIGSNLAVSTSHKEKTVVVHDMTFEEKRKIEKAFRNNWQ